MRKIIFVEELQLGNFLFRGYVVQHVNDLLSYSIFVNDFEKPFIELLADNTKTVTLKFNNEISDYIDINKTKDQKIRKEIFKAFMTFMLESEKKASYMVFKNEKLKYVKSSKEIVELKSRYIFG